MFSIYCHTNLFNNKKYVGVTAQRPKQRWQDGKGYSKHKAFYEDIIKYGWDNFKHEILYVVENKEEAERLERELIKTYDLTNPNKGYNKSKGGVIPTLNEEARKKLTHNTNFKGRKHTAQTKERMSKNRPKKAVICIDTGISYESTREAEKQTGTYHGDISKCCKGTLKKAGGHKWIYKE